MWAVVACRNFKLSADAVRHFSRGLYFCLVMSLPNLDNSDHCSTPKFMCRPRWRTCGQSTSRTSQSCVDEAPSRYISSRRRHGCDKGPTTACRNRGGISYPKNNIQIVEIGVTRNVGDGYDALWPWVCFEVGLKLE